MTAVQRPPVEQRARLRAARAELERERRRDLARRMAFETAEAQGFEPVITDLGTLARIAVIARQPNTPTAHHAALLPAAGGVRATASHSDPPPAEPPPGGHPGPFPPGRGAHSLPHD